MAAFPARDEPSFMAHWTRTMADETAILRTILFRGQVAGNVGSWEQEGRRKVGLRIGRAFWGRGVASSALAAFLAVDETRPLYAHVAKHNVASIRGPGEVRIHADRGGTRAGRTGRRGRRRARPGASRPTAASLTRRAAAGTARVRCGQFGCRGIGPRPERPGGREQAQRPRAFAPGAGPVRCLAPRDALRPWPKLRRPRFTSGLHGRHPSFMFRGHNVGVKKYSKPLWALAALLAVNAAPDRAQPGSPRSHARSRTTSSARTWFAPRRS